MAVITIPKKTFEKEIGKLSESMQNKIAMFGTPIEKIDEKELQIEIFPNRPDLLSYQGFKRAFLSFIEKRKKPKSYKVNKPEKKYKVIVDSGVRNIRPYTACAIVKGLRLNDEKIKEIIKVQEKLHITVGRKRKKSAIGIYPLEKISLPITFKALEPDKIKFTPLGSKKEMSGLEILQKHPTGKEYSHLLAGKMKFPVFIDSKKQILSMPPIINSQFTGKINPKTKDAFIECSGSDFKILEKCLNIIVTMLSDMGGKIYQMNLKGMKGKDVKGKTPELKTEKIPLKIENAEKLLGIELSEKSVKKYLRRMEMNYRKGKVEIPPWRTDILHEVDIIEDIAIAYGYGNFEPEIPKVFTIGEENREESVKRKISEILSGIKFLETSSYHLTNKKDQIEKMNLRETKKPIKIEESKTDYDLLRENLTHKALKILSENIDSEYPQKIFKIGKVFGLEDEKISEEEHLCIAISPGNFTEIKQTLEYVFRMLGLKKPIFSELKETEKHFVDGRTAEIRLGEKPIGTMGEIHPKILSNWKIKMPVSLLEIDIEEVFEKLKSN